MTERPRGVPRARSFNMELTDAELTDAELSESTTRSADEPSNTRKIQDVFRVRSSSVPKQSVPPLSFPFFDPTALLSLTHLDGVRAFENVTQNVKHKNEEVGSGAVTSRVDRFIREQELRRKGRLSAAGTAEEEEEVVIGQDVYGKSKAKAPKGTIQRESIRGFTSGDTDTRQRLLVVANRLPVTCSKDGSGWNLVLSVGGLVSALLGVKKNYRAIWVGWPGLEVSDEGDRAELAAELHRKGCIPVWLDEESANLYYNGYCNNVLWPLFHYMGLPAEDRLSTTQSMHAQWLAYKRVNSMFADAIMREYQPGDVVWCHDYHLMLLPANLKIRSADIKVGWFLHTPFPSSEIYRSLPLREEILEGVLHADLVGFHTYDYARHFTSACCRVLGTEGTPDGVDSHGNFTRVAAFPIGIDPERFIDALETEIVQTQMAELRSQFAGRKVMLGVDRLDMIKGIPQKLLAFEKFLEENTQWRDKVLLVQIAIPSRTYVPEYQKLASLVHEIVGRINGRFGTVGSVPIHHLDRVLSFPELCALYAVTDVALVTSLRDGMNLVSYEYVACQNNKKGVLILSEFAGAAQSLGAGALLVNPWNVNDVAACIDYALNMSEGERRERQDYNFRHVTTHTAQAWADDFIAELNDTVTMSKAFKAHIPSALSPTEHVLMMNGRKHRLLILGHQFTLTSVPKPRRMGRLGGVTDMDAADSVVFHPGCKQALTRLAADPRCTIVILSGSTREHLDKFLGPMPIWVAAENGVFLRNPAGEWTTVLTEALNLEWKESVQLVMDYFCDRTPRSFLQERETSLVWNYRNADVEFGRLQARDLLQHLWTGPISNTAVDVLQGLRSVEVRPTGLTKGLACDRLLHEIIWRVPELRQRAERRSRTKFPFDAVFCCGHWLSKDEDIFEYFAGSGGSSPRPTSKGDETVTAANGSSQPLPRVGSRRSRLSISKMTAAAAAAAAAAECADTSPRPPIPPPTVTTIMNSQQLMNGRYSPSFDKEILEDGPVAAAPAGEGRGDDRGESTGEGNKGEGKGEEEEKEAPSLPSRRLKFDRAEVLSCAVGRRRSPAKHHVDSSDKVSEFLNALADSIEPWEVGTEGEDSGDEYDDEGEEEGETLGGANGQVLSSVGEVAVGGETPTASSDIRDGSVSDPPVASAPAGLLDSVSGTVRALLLA
eukprot:jgi/Mesvir1/27067/Mv20760-RA.1